MGWKRYTKKATGAYDRLKEKVDLSDPKSLLYLSPAAPLKLGWDASTKLQDKVSESINGPAFEAPGEGAGALSGAQMDLFGRMREAGQSAISGKYGTLRGGLQADFSGRGLGRSGFMGSELSRLSAHEKGEMAGLEADLEAKRQGLETGNWDLAMQQAMQDYEQGQSKLNRKYSILSAGLGTAGKLIGAGI